jgi:sterol desaturase/sphingolipid hydroxylase (fatty acid hydroxylase superfamily)
LLVGLAELCRARRRRQFPALRRRFGNIGIWILNLLLAAFFLPPPQSVRPWLASVLGVGLPAWPIADALLSAVAAFLLLDFLHYAVHRWQHAARFLWRFHALHHSDPDVDVTTSVRHHPIEYLIAAAIYWLAVLALDIPIAVVMSHGLAVFAAAVVTHGNIRLPEWLERALQPVTITLDLHLIHHSVVYAEANSNYGAVLSVWDRLFGTFTPASRARLDNLTFGVQELPQRASLTISAMFLTPWLLGRAAASARE